VTLGGCAFVNVVPLEVEVVAEVDETVLLPVTEDVEDVTVELGQGIAVVEFEKTTGKLKMLGPGVGSGTRSVLCRSRLRKSRLTWLHNW
jgi:hypothetical protein